MTFELAPPPAPVDPEEIVMHVGDRVTVQLPTEDGCTHTVIDEIDRAGMMLLPEVGRVRLVDLSREAAEAYLE